MQAVSACEPLAYVDFCRNRPYPEGLQLPLDLIRPLPLPHDLHDFARLWMSWLLGLQVPGKLDTFMDISSLLKKVVSEPSRWRGLFRRGNWCVNIYIYIYSIFKFCYFEKKSNKYMRSYDWWNVNIKCDRRFVIDLKFHHIFISWILSVSLHIFFKW